MLVPMSKVYIVGLKDCFFETLNQLQEYGKLHLADLNEDIDSGRVPIGHMVLFEAAAEQLEQMKSLQQRGNALIAGLFGKERAPCEWALEPGSRVLSIPEVISESGDYIASLEPKSQGMLNHVSDLEIEKAELLQYEPLLTKVEPIIEANLDGADLFSMALIIESRFEDTIGALRDALIEATDESTRVISAPLDEEMIAIIIIAEHTHAHTIRSIIIEEQFASIKLPKAFGELPFSEALAQMRERLEFIDDDIIHAKEELALFAEAQRARLCFVSVELENRIAQLEVVDQFGETRYSFVVVGYLAQDSVDEMSKYFEERLPCKVSIEAHDIQPEDYSVTPVELKNKKEKTGFQAALGIWGTPTYGSFDATAVLAWSFPLIFAFIVGDAGYGLVLLLICLFLKFKFGDNKAAQVVYTLFMPTAIATIIVGILYWEFFGDLAIKYIPVLRDIQPIQLGGGFSLPLIRTHGEGLTAFLFLALAIGVIVVAIGLILGIINNKRLGHKKHVIEKAGLLTIVFAAIMIAAVSIMPNLTAGLAPAAAAGINYVVYAVLAFGFILTIYGGGILGAIETVETASHIASFIRIMAVGLVGALLADAANKLMFETMPNFAGLFIALILHILNFAIIMFSPSIHSLRLSFLEFFGKFWVPTKVVYKPFAKIEKEGR